MRPGSIDYTLLYFKYKMITPIREKSNNKTLKRLQIEIEANASLVKTDLGGGNHRYLGLYSEMLNIC